MGEIGACTANSLLSCMRMCSSIKVQKSDDLAAGVLKVQWGMQSYIFDVGSHGNQFHVKPRRHGLLMPHGGVNWCIVARERARAYIMDNVLSSACDSPQQAARHVAACAM